MRILKCPVCKCDMIKQRISELGPTVETDHCLRCGGTWFDVGEYESLRAQLLEERTVRDGHSA